MAYENFKPVIWSKIIEKTLRQKAIFADFCNTNIQGEPAYGNSVKILGAGVPTVYQYNQESGLKDPEKPDGTVVTMNIDQANAFNFMVDDIDRAQANPTLMSSLMDEAASELAGAKDRYIASLAAEATNVSTSTAVTTAAQAKKMIDAGLRQLRENNVGKDKNVRIELTYWLYQLFRDYLVEAKTSNDALLKNGTVGFYDNCAVAYSNNIHNDGTDDYCMIRTDKAIAYASQVTETEAYRPEKYFSDAVKGLDVFGSKIVRQNEIYVIKAHTS